VVKLLNIELPLNYHVVVFVCIIPVLLVVEYFYLTSNIILLLASFFGILIFEDFFWFLLNWNFDSLNQLTKGPHGSIWWHKRWVKVLPERYIPASYPMGLILTFGLLVLA